MVMSVKVSAMCCRSFLPITYTEVVSQPSTEFSWGWFKDFQCLDSQGKLSLYWAVSYGRIFFHHYLSL